MKTSKLKEQQVALATTQQGVLLAINSEFEALMSAVDNLPEVMVGDKDAYDKATELKRKVKATHVAIEKKRKELKAPILEMGKNLDTFAKGLSEPLKSSEKVIKERVSAYEQEIERIKAEKTEIKRQLEQQAEQHKKNLEWIQENMQSLIEQIKSCNSLKGLNSLQDKLCTFYDIVGSFDLDDAGKGKGIFAINQVREYCKMKGDVLKMQEQNLNAQEISDNIEQDDHLLDFESMSLAKDQPMSEVLEEVNVFKKGKVKSIQLPNGAGGQLELIKDLYELVEELATILPVNIALDKALSEKYNNTIAKVEQFFLTQEIK